MKIKEVKKFDIKVYDAIVRLLPQLTTSKPPTKKHFKKILKSKDAYFFIAKENKEIIGTLLLISFNTLCGNRYWIEDVIIDEAHRGKGFGKEITEYAINFAKSLGAEAINLTSQPARIAANQLYQKLGFTKIETNYYRFYVNE